MADWEGFRDVLNELYMVENKPLMTVIEIMGKEHEFTAAKFEYEAQFKQWDWHKNMKKSDWIYVVRKTDQRKKSGRPESAVYLRGNRVPPSKVKKEVSRQVHPNEFYNFSDLPPSPGYMTVCTPPPENIVSDLTTGKRKPHEVTFQETSGSKRRQVEATKNLMYISDRSPLSHTGFWRNKFHETGEVDLSGLPYFQFRDIMGSSDFIKGFEQILSSNDALAQNLIRNFWPRPSSQLSLDSNVPSSSYLDSDPEWTLATPYPSLQVDQTQLFKPFGANLLYGDNDSICEGLDTFDILDRTRMDLSSLLSNIPRSSDEEIQSLTNILLGSPTIEAARRFIEVGVYISSNDLGSRSQMNQFISSMLQLTPWSVLGPILSAQVPTIQAFAEKVFLFAISTEKIHVVRELLHRPPLVALVRSSARALVLAVCTSNTELVSLLLEVGADFEGDEDSERPLVEARTLAVARLLIGAGANLNATGIKWSDYPEIWSGTAVHHAIRCGNIAMTRYFINLGADIGSCQAYQIDTEKRSRVAFSALMLGVERGSIEICRLLLQTGVSMIDAIVDKPPECKHCVERLDHYISCEPHMTVFQRAAALGNCAILELLLEHKAHVNAPAQGIHGETALEAAVSKGQLKAVTFLLANDADVNAPGNNDTCFPRHVLTTAVELNHYELVQTLLDAGAEVNVPSFGIYGSVALESAAVMDKCSSIYKLLVTRGSLQLTEIEPRYYQARLREAVLQGDLGLVRQIVDSGMRFDMDSFFVAILQNSVQRSTISGTEIFHLLLRPIIKSGEDVDLYPLLIEAIEVSNLEILAALLDADANINAKHGVEGDIIGTPLMFAVEQNNCSTVVFLLDKGADINAVVEGFGNVLEKASTALQVALQRSRYDMYHLLLDRGATINALISQVHGRSELAFAVETGDITLVQHILELGARVNDPPAPDYGLTALQAAANFPNPNIAIIQLLLKWGADINGPISKKGGMSALGAAARWGHFQIAVILLEAGAAVDALDSNGHSPLFRAAFYVRLDMVHLLLKAGANVSLCPHWILERNIAIRDLVENWKKNETPLMSYDSSNRQLEEIVVAEEL